MQITIVVMVGLIVLPLIVAALKPGRFQVRRSTAISARPDQVFPFIEDFRRWRAWSPWEDVDPDLTRTYSGPESGKGSVYEWAGKKAGAGRMEIMDAPAPSRVTIKLDFSKPFEAHNTSEFGLEGKGAATDVTWTMHGPQPYAMRLMTLFVSMDKLIGRDFEKGLANLKAAAEGRQGSLKA